jgi:hypothetical protein
MTARGLDQGRLAAVRQWMAILGVEVPCQLEQQLYVFRPDRRQLDLGHAAPRLRI